MSLIPLLPRNHPTAGPQGTVGISFVKFSTLWKEVLPVFYTH